MELYQKTVTESIAYMDDELSYGVYELRWKSRSETNPFKSIVVASSLIDRQTLPVTSDHEFFQVSFSTPYKP